MVSSPVRCVAALIAALLCSCGGSQAPVVAVVQVPAGMPVGCVQVIARAAPAGVKQTGLIPAQAGSEHRVAVYPGDALGSGAITVEAEGFSGAECSEWIAASDPVPAAFGPEVTEVPLPLKACGGPCADGGVPDGGTPDGGAPDAGQGCGAGRDAGQACGSGGACSSAGVCVPGFLYPPSNFVPTTITTIAPAITLNCNTSFDSTTLAFGNNWCGQPKPVPVQISQDGGVPAILLATSDFTVTASGSLTLTGRSPVIFAVFGNASLLGNVVTDAGADLSPACDLAHGGVGHDDSTNGGGGGGGGAFGTASGAGGQGGSVAGGDGGQPAGSPKLVPLIGGCSGSRGGAGVGAGGVPGSAGGAFQCSASGTLRVSAIVGAPGQGGRRGNGGGGAGLAGGGGGGAGSGGGLLFEGQVVQVTGTALLTANGGGGGEGGGTNNTGIDGQPGSITSATPAQGGNVDPPNFPGFGGNGGAGTTLPQNGQPARSLEGGGGGGGGAVGRIRINAAAAGGCAVDAGVLSPPPTGNGSPGCP